MKIAAVQMDIAWQDREANHAKAKAMAVQAADGGADLLILPEMFATGFSMDTSVTAEDIDGKTPGLIRALAVEHKVNIIAGFVLTEGHGKPKNVALAVNRDGADLSLYAKTHLIGLLGEDQNYGAGDGPKTFVADGVGVSTLICYDLRFPEIFRAVADDVSVIVVIASWPSVRAAHWQTLLPARAVENQCYVVGVNRVGSGGGHDFTGGSMVIDALGKVVQLGSDQEELIVVDIDPQEVLAVREKMPFLRDRKR